MNPFHSPSYTSPSVVTLYDIPNPQKGVEFYSIVLSEYSSEEPLYFVKDDHGIWHDDKPPEHITPTYNGETLFGLADAYQEFKAQIKRRIAAGFCYWLYRDLLDTEDTTIKLKKLTVDDVDVEWP